MQHVTFIGRESSVYELVYDDGEESEEYQISKVDDVAATQRMHTMQIMLQTCTMQKTQWCQFTLFVSANVLKPVVMAIRAASAHFAM